MRRSIRIQALIFVVCCHVNAQRHISTIWSVDLEDGGGSSSNPVGAVPNKVFIVWDGESFQVLNSKSSTPNSKPDVPITARAEGSDLTFTVATGEGELPDKRPSPRRVTLTGFFDRSSPPGAAFGKSSPVGHAMVATPDGKTLPFQWKAERLASLWQCSNHTPSHAATTEEEVRNLTSVQHCTGWHKVQAEPI